MRGIFLFVVLLASCLEEAQAQTTFSLDPAQAVAGEIVTLRLDDATGCFPANLPTIVRSGSTVTFRAHINDSIPPGVPPGGCPPEWVTPRFFSLGPFTPGHYTVEAIICTNSPGPDPCALDDTLQLHVSGSAVARFTVPALSVPMVVGMAFAMMLIGVMGLPDRWIRCTAGRGRSGLH